MPRSAPSKFPAGSIRSLFGGLFLLLVLSGGPAEAASTLGAVTGEGRLFRTPEQLRLWANELGSTLKETVTVRIFTDQEQLLDWLLRYREVDFALIGAERLRRIPAGQLTTVHPQQGLPVDNPGSEQLVAGPEVTRQQLERLATTPAIVAALLPNQETAALPTVLAEPETALSLPAAREYVPSAVQDGLETAANDAMLLTGGSEPADDADAVTGHVAEHGEPEALVVGFRLNGEERGALVVYRDNGGFLARSEDLAKLGIVELPKPRRTITGEEHIPLQEIAGSMISFDEAAGELALTVPPTVFAGTRIDFQTQRRPGVLRPRDDSQFLNYGVEYRAVGESLEEESYRWTGELGGRFGDYLLLTDGFYDDNGGENRFVRLQSRVIRDDRDTLRRYTAGDLVAYAGRFSSRLSLGGIGVAKTFAIDPYYIENPMYRFSGIATLPTTLEIYVDGQRIRTEQLAPGPFAIEHLWQTLGTRDVELVLRDSLGRETRIDSPYNFSNRLLRRGLHEYSYNLGMLRRNYGVQSDDYADVAWSGFHRYGVNDDLTLGVQTEGGDGLGTLGGGAIYRLGPWGTLDLEVAGSRDGNRQGAAGFAGYTFQARYWQWQVEGNVYSPEFATLDNRDWGRHLRANLAASIGYISPELGSLTFSYARSDGRSETDREQFTASYYRSLGRQLSLGLSHTRRSGAEHEFYARLSYYFDRVRDVSFTTEFRHAASADSQNVELNRTVPTGEGVGWRAAANRFRDESGETVSFAPFVQYNAPFGSYRADYSMLDRNAGRPDEQSLLLAAAGGVAHVDGRIGISRPIRDSFGLVRVGDVEGVRVYVNNQQVGRTGEDGTLFVPELNSYFENQVSIENKDVPIDYLMAVTRRDVSPPLRSGSCIDFPTQRYQSFWGKLLATVDDAPLDLAFGDCRLETANGVATFSIDGDGNFFFDTTDLGKNLALQAVGCTDRGAGTGPSLAGPGTLRCRLDSVEVVCPFETPASTEPAIDLGARECRATLVNGQ
ncbi:MAG: fimbria/pilus outer membrane usher protein [Desulfuromonadales bacterium]